ncbi:2-C-methyl-D-erythritol 2,4-cyclodiphosphate synthase [Thiothrix eikelboomii]|uniref:2-C-methyl-D-erythritol 2,4-cyclodiphosphate synthase n=1 Tax=Thiothrix eikelboomii TaxID=92487 RepID=A0A1T4XRY9_9GAMM|nr:2-C-methyl-D-erythritol 2,4-cyclodiphosphate synthase [Thiothrix eikelboomii]SKA92294.1 2-C-methyl-D-erythritol 2,4-cyclodiphosphate synthase [Thiothrix eikelboomii]
MRIGQGYDVHAFTEGDHLVLGGVRIPYTHAFAAHSDGDVLIHAICDALLGALALGDIGLHFPDTSAAYAKIDSRILLRKVRQLIKDQGYQIANLDSIIVAQAPKMAAYMSAMRANLAADLDCELSQISVKATTTERLGFEGRKEGIAAHAVVLLVSIHRSI